MSTLWFAFIAAMLAVYVVLDGFDLGAGIIHLGVARNDGERRMVLRSIGPFWDGNEVWLLAAGGTLYLAFPALYASSFSGFYLPLIMVLWLLILRGISIEFRSHIDSPVWKPLWDVVFSLASGLLAIFLGAALGNVIRGVPLNASGEFFLPLWTDFGVSGDVGILDWYTVTTGLLAFLALTHHGARWVALKARGAVEARARRIGRVAWWGVGALTLITTIFTMRVQPHIWEQLTNHPSGFVFPAIALAGWGAAWSRQRDLRAFLGSCAYIGGMLSSCAFGLYPYLLPSNGDTARSLTVSNAAAGDYGLQTALFWWVPGVLLASSYFVFIHRHFAGKVGAEAEHY